MDKTHTELEKTLIQALRDILALSPKNYWEADLYPDKVEEVIKAALKKVNK